ncbi:MAG: ammonia monooxygenase [Rickettsiales bacterium]|nr:ammonia monooxygenase [Rickettsiales bacterium]
MSKAEEVQGGGVLINCPGCGMYHALNVDPKNGRPCWEFNNDYDKPTFKPSLLVRWPINDEAKSKGVCHSFITDGNIQFLSDCTHDKAGMTLPLNEVD